LSDWVVTKLHQAIGKHDYLSKVDALSGCGSEMLET